MFFLPKLPACIFLVHFGPRSTFFGAVVNPDHKSTRPKSDLAANVIFQPSPTEFGAQPRTMPDHGDFQGSTSEGEKGKGLINFGNPLWERVSHTLGECNLLARTPKSLWRIIGSMI